MKSAEFDFIAWAQKQIGPDPSVLLPSGDDTAILKTDAKTALTTDALVDTIHFDLANQRPGDIGKKAINVNVSDIASMGMQPSHCVITFCVPESLNQDKLRRIFSGMISACRQSQLSIVGGDFTRSPGPLMINVAMTGRAIKKNCAPLTRCGAKLGDSLFVTGRLGGSLKGKHLRFTPRLDEVKKILKLGCPHAMIDISDGLSSEIHHICRGSQVGARLCSSAIPIARAATNGTTSALHDGEDFELLFTAGPRLTSRLLKEWNHPTPLSKIGIITPAAADIVIHEEGKSDQQLLPQGWIH